MYLAQSRRQTAQSLIEFGLLLALVAVVAIAGLLIFGGTVSSMMTTLSTTVSVNVTAP
jgi:Flp pilus assembly pilin Flp